MSGAGDIGVLLARLERLEAESAIRGVMARYMELCDRLDATTPMDELGALFTRDALWAGKGARYGAAFGGHCGRDAIVAMLDRYRGPVPYFAMNAHFLTSEVIRVEGDAAEGSWVMLQTSTYASGTSDLRAARLHVRFAVEEGRWRIARFETENLFSRPVDRWDDPAPVPVPDSHGD
ncbi:polyketide cyclase [Sphingomonas oleivorans]|uniref:Polyketide cyclase n=1 Tax=Sphingomonas oleivorans TaxID=1735121 RepID=A0A2T5G2B4_9SPHN|nr:nuclear transport factor 2 family protein [Sphingomonas oleivorans]PTQ13251.1 polyketide cyclase [Sphingomonas oleivorans]